jgi:2-polyprenyl-3-methyl-5-hydroxy-6-metoxy-1,4-benzoquinol methylase
MASMGIPGDGGAAPATGLEAPDVETSSEGYAGRFAGPVGEWFLEVQARTTLELLGRWPGASVLDIGGGHGQMTGPLVEAGFDVTIVASSEGCCERVREWVDGGRARFRVAALTATGLDDRCFDVVLSYRLLAHLPAWRDLVAELCRLSRRAVIVDYPSRRSVNVLSQALFGLKRGVERNTRPFLVFRDADLEEAFATHGFQTSARRPQFLAPMALHRSLGIATVSRGIEAVAAGLGLTRGFGSPVILRLERDG